MASAAKPRAPRRASVPAIVLALLATVGGAALVVQLASGPAHTAATTTTTVVATTTTPPTTTTTVDVGALPQTHALPTTSSPALARRLQAYLDSISTGHLRPGLRAFFPLAAYLQTKSGGGNDADWHYRLVAHYADDLATLHARLDPSGRQLRFVDVRTPDGATWVTPGQEENKGPYWRTYDTIVRYRFGTTGAIHQTTVLCMISWRGAWFIVHVLSFA